MAYIDEKCLAEFGKQVVNLVEKVTEKKETMLTETYCKSACKSFTNKEYTTDNFPFRFTVKGNNTIYIKGISDAGLTDETFDKINVTINSEYKVGDITYTVTGIDDYGFAMATAADKTEQEEDVMFAMESITLPLTVTHLGNRAFCDNRSVSTSKYQTKRKLKYINGLDNVTEVVGAGTFAFCPNLKSIYLPRLNSLVPNMFMRSTAIEKICIGEVTTIPDQTFDHCYRLQSITKRDNSQFNITEIGYKSFDRAIALKEFNFNLLDVQSVGEEAFFFCDFECDWQTMVDNGCVFGLRATKYQMWAEETLKHKFTKTPCINTNGKNYAFMQSFNGWKKLHLGDSETLTYGSNGCSWCAMTLAYNILSGQDLLPIQFNDLVKHSRDSEKANQQIMANSSTTESQTIACLTELPMETFQTVEGIQGVYNGLAEGNIYRVLMTTSYQRGQFEPTGTHALLIVGVDADGKLILAESNYAGANLNEPTSGLIHIDLLNCFTDKTYGEEAIYLYNWVNKVKYNSEYEV